MNRRTTGNEKLRRRILVGTIVVLAALPFLMTGASTPLPDLSLVEKQYDPIYLSRCYDCEPPEIIDVVGTDMNLRTINQSGDANTIALSYFGGLIENYAASPSITRFFQSVFNHSRDWYFKVNLDSDYTEYDDLASSIRKVDESAVPSAAGGERQNECNQEINNVPGAYVTLPEGIVDDIVQELTYCESVFPGPDAWWTCHNEAQPPQGLPPMIKNAKYHVPSSYPDCEEMIYDICVEISDVIRKRQGE